MTSRKRINRRHIKLYDDICGRVDTAALSELLPAVLRLGRALDNCGLVRWARLELEGYVHGNPAMGDDITVPEYRTVVGQYYDDYGRRLVLDNAELGFIFEDRVRFGVPQLESLARRDEIRVQRTSGIEAVREHLGVEVTTFGFPSISVQGVLGSIRSELAGRLADLDDEIGEAREELSEVGDSDLGGSSAGWIREHLWQILIAITAGLVVAFLTYVFGWG